MHENMETSSKVRSFVGAHWRWVSAAAVMLVIVAAGILWMPQTVTAPRGEFATVTLPDGSTVELNSGSKLQYNRLYGITNRSVSISGEAFFVVEEGDLPFTVLTNGATVQVTGTRFNVRSWHEYPQGETEVAVEEGSVAFYPGNKPSRSVTLERGQLSRWAPTLKKPSNPESISVEKVSAWRSGKLNFDQKSLGIYLSRARAPL
ncbi:MAG: FecR domain-containing protein [Fodinibius sp.]|nr:FecR domain-containing protein [Fodinibius sp.]